MGHVVGCTTRTIHIGLKTYHVGEFIVKPVSPSQLLYGIELIELLNQVKHPPGKPGRR